jgi:glycosyltransferase involved in cell wall biosynthesis
VPARILHIIYSLNRGGAERYLMDVLRRYDRQRFHMDVCYLAPQPGDWADEARALGANLLPAPESHLLYPLYRRFRALLRRHRYDAVCFHGEQYLPCALLAAAKNRVPGLAAFLHTTQCFARMRLKHRLYHRWAMFVLKRLQPNVACASEAIAQAHFPGPLRPQFHVQVIHYGIDTHRFASAPTHRADARAELHLPPNVPVVGHVGRFHPAKNHAGFIRAAALIAAARPDARFVLVGDGPLRTQIEQQIQRANLSDCFLLTGVRPDVERILGAFDLLLFPSHWEGLPIAVLEAQAAHLPVVASRIQPMLEACPSENQPLLHDPDDHAALAQSALSLLNDPATAASAADAGARWVQQNFDIHTSVAKLCLLLQTASRHTAVEIPQTQ